MIYFLKGAAPVIALATVFSDEISAILGFTALAAIVGSVLTYNRIRAALVASEAAGKAWREERDAAASHVQRVQASLVVANDEKTKLIAEVAALEKRPDLSRLESLVSESTDSMKRHEVSAAERTDRLIAAIEKIQPAG
jgi:hypothetical protein